MTGRNYRTVKKYIEKEDFNEDNHKAKKASKSDILRPIIQKWIQEDLDRPRKQRHTARRVYDRLKSEHGELLHVGARTIRTLVKKEKKKIYKINTDAHLRLEYPARWDQFLYLPLPFKLK